MMEMSFLKGNLSILYAGCVKSLWKFIRNPQKKLRKLKNSMKKCFVQDRVHVKKQTIWVLCMTELSFSDITLTW